jgi:hypothetical protein
MTSTAKTILAVVVVAILATGFYVWYTGTNPFATTNGSESDSTALPSGSDNSDAALQQDLTTINANVQATNADSQAVDSSMNAQGSGSGY